MAKTIEKSAKTVEDALKAAIEELGVNENEIDYEIVEEASRGFFGFGAKPAKIRVTVKEDGKNDEPINEVVSDVINEKTDMKEKKENSIESISEPSEPSEQTEMQHNLDEEKIETAKRFLQDVLADMKLKVTIETIISENDYTFNIHGEDLGMLIGKHGQTLDALQYLVNLASNRNESKRIRFIVDVENYRSRRTETLKNLAKNLADRAIKMNQEVKLEPMNRHERKVIHVSLQDNDKITTCSRGEEPFRYIVISPRK